MSGAVLDTNILVSALLGSPSAKKLLTALDQNRFTLILPDSLLQLTPQQFLSRLS